MVSLGQERSALGGLEGRVEPGAEAFKRDVPDAEVRFVDSGHFALETHAREIGAAMRDFLARRLG